VILVPALWWASSQVKSLAAVGWTHAVVAFIGGAITLIVAARLMNISFWKIFAALRPSIVAGGFMSLVVWGVLYITAAFSPWLQLVLGILTGAATYLAALALTQKGIFQETWEFLRSNMFTRSQVTE
jgi:PST family polysaccharide transporter